MASLTLLLDKIALKEKTAYMSGLVVDPEYRRKSLGKYVLTQALNYCLERNINKCLLTVRKDNNNAIHLYKRFGFKTVGKEREYYAFKL